MAVCFLLSDWYRELNPQEKAVHSDDPHVKLKGLSIPTGVQIVI
jgi:hypothetical protein